MLSSTDRSTNGDIMNESAMQTSFAHDGDRRDQEEESLIQILFAHTDELECPEYQKVSTRQRTPSGANSRRDVKSDREEEELLQALFAHIDEYECSSERKERQWPLKASTIS